MKGKIIALVLLVGVLVVFAVLSGISDEEREVPWSTPSPPVPPQLSGVKVLYRITGGIAGVDDRLYVCADGRVGLTTPHLEGQLSPDELRALDVAVLESDFFTLRGEYQDRGADLTARTITYEGTGKRKSVRVELWSEPPAAFLAVEKKLKEAIEALAAHAPSGMMMASRKGVLRTWPYTSRFSLTRMAERYPNGRQISYADVPRDIQQYVIEAGRERQAVIYFLEAGKAYRVGTPVVANGNADLSVSAVNLGVWSGSPRLSELTMDAPVPLSGGEYADVYKRVRSHYDSAIEDGLNLFIEGSPRDGVILYYAAAAPQPLPSALPEPFCEAKNNTSSKPASGDGAMVTYRVNSWPENRFTVLVCGNGKIGLSGQTTAAVGSRKLYAEDRISPQEIGGIEEAFENDKFFALEDVYPAPPGLMDGGTAEITYTRGNRTKTITDNGGAPLPNVEGKLLTIFRALEAQSQGGEARSLPEDFCS